MVLWIILLASGGLALLITIIKYKKEEKGKRSPLLMILSCAVIVVGIIGTAYDKGLFNPEPNLLFHLDTYSISNLRKDGKMYHVFLTEASIQNDGNKTYFPTDFEMEIMLEDSIYKFYPLAIPPNNQINFEGHKALIPPEKDLLRITQIPPNSSVTGYIFFILPMTPQNMRRNFSNHEYLRYVIFNSKNKGWRTKKIKNKATVIKERPYNPKSGIEIK
jgi:hypothetical protein